MTKIPTLEYERWEPIAIIVSQLVIKSKGAVTFFIRNHHFVYITNKPTSNEGDK